MQPAKTEETTADDEDETAAPAGAKILVVDDEPNICRVLDRLLTREGYNVETASIARRALERLNDEHFDLILLDIKMPDMDGM